MNKAALIKLNLKMIRGFFIALLVSVASNIQAADPDPVIVTIGGKKVTKNEFLRTYNKNNPDGKYDLKSLQDYMELFINYKLKVVEAENLGFDTVSSFVSEFKSYREQLARPYLTDKETEERLAKEVWDRLHYDVRARQILIRAGELLPPTDTIEPYKKAWEAYNKLMAGEPWDSVYNKYAQDISTNATKGDLGYFTALQMIYPFENTCYNLKVGEISKPVRTHLGFHIIQLLDRRPSIGEIKVQHIMVAFPENATKSQIDSARNIIAEVYKKLQNGEKFEDLARQYSDDKRSAAKGGELNWFGTGQMISDFENAAFSLKNDGDYTQPFRTPFGWHIIRRVAVRPISPYEEMKSGLIVRMSRGDRGDIVKQAMVNKAKQKYGFSENKAALLQLAQLIDSSAYKGLWDPEKAANLKNVKLFTIGNKTYSVYDYAKYMAKYRFKRPATVEMSINHFYNQYLQKTITDYINSQLENDYPEFRFLLQEYHDGILLFNLMEQKVWMKAARDSVGLLKFYNDHKERFVWKDRIEALVVTSKDKEQVDKAYSFANDFYNNKIAADKIWKSICSDTTEACFNCQVMLFEKGDNQILDSIGWDMGISPIVFKDGKYGFFVKKRIEPGRPKTYEEAKGSVIADYQEFLEKQYITELRKKYPVTVDQKVLASLVKK